jgi:hypothetical protein
MIKDDARDFSVDSELRDFSLSVDKEFVEESEALILLVIESMFVVPTVKSKVDPSGAADEFSAAEF